MADAEAVGFKRLWKGRQLDTKAKIPGGFLSQARLLAVAENSHYGQHWTSCPEQGPLTVPAP